MFCRSCGHELQPRAVACTKCGCSPLAGAKFCPDCGEETQPAAVICVKCGVWLKQQAAAVKSKVAAGILGIFLGAFGVHRFYLGYTGLGLTMLLLSLVGGMLTFGVVTGAIGVWGFIEGILILIGNINEDADGNPLGD